MIKISNLQKSFGKLEVLRDIDLTIEKGKIYAILGPNGSGKTTLIKCLLGIVIKSKGTIEVNGKRIEDSSEYRNDISYLSQIANFPDNLKAYELLNMIKDIRGEAADENHLIDLFDLRSHLNKPLYTLSGGTKQKLNLVLTFMFDTSIVILDEPTSGIDPVSLIKLKKYIHQLKDEGKTVIITSHIMSFVEEIADEILFLLEGEIRFKGNKQALYKITGESNFENAIANLLQKDYA